MPTHIYLYLQNNHVSGSATWMTPK